jgi:hypothetical protein
MVANDHISLSLAKLKKKIMSVSALQSLSGCADMTLGIIPLNFGQQCYRKGIIG